MKRNLVSLGAGALVAVAVLFVASCAQNSGVESGALSLGPVEIRAASGAASGDWLTRYRLTRNGAPQTINGQPYVEVAQTSSLTVNDLLPGGGYGLAVSVGKKQDSAFDVKYYGNVGFSIAAGSTTAVTLNLAKTPDYTWLNTDGKNSSAVVVNGTIYLLDGSVLKWYTPGSTVVVGSASLPTERTYNSLAAGKYFSAEKTISPALWVNTSAGLYRWTGTALDRDMDTSLNPNVVLSGAIEMKDSNQNPLVFGLYSGGSKTLGMVVATKQEKFDSGWYTIDKGMDEYKEIKDIVDLVSIDLVTDLNINENNFYYVAMPLGTLIGNERLKSLVSDSVDAFRKDPFGFLNNFWLKIGDGTAVIERVSSAGNRVFASPAAPKSGLYTQTVYSTSAEVVAAGSILGAPTGALELVSGTDGYNFSAIASYKASNGTIWSAAVTKGNSVMILEGSQVRTTLDAATGIPDNAKPTFYQSGESVYCVLAGSNGALAYQVK